MKSRILPILMTFGSIICVLIFYFFYGKPWNLISNKNNFNTYLEEKYNKDFVIEDISFDFFHGRTYHAYAHAKETPNLTFYVGQNPYSKETEDSYHDETWRKQANEELGPIVEKYFPDNFNYAVEIYPMNNLSISEVPQILNFKEFSTVDIGISMDEYVVTNENWDSEIERSYLLLSALKEEGIKFNHFGISYQNKTIQLQPDEIRTISNPDDLKIWLNDYIK